MNKNIIVSNNNIVFSDIQENDTYLMAKFIVCDFNPNLNEVMLNRQTIGNWINTLVDQPVVGKIDITSDNGEADFTSHNANIVIRTDENGNPYQDIKFDTSAIGVFTNVDIESISGKEYIVADAKIWKRFPDVCAVIKRRMQDGTIATSWEILVKKSHNQFIDGQMVEVIDDGAFEGHCLLNEFVPPAYPDSKLLSVASKQNISKNIVDSELVEALKRDIVTLKDSNINLQKEDGDNLAKNETKTSTEKTDETTKSVVTKDISEVKKDVKNQTETTENIEKAEKSDDKPTDTKVEKAELTDNDVRQGLYNAISEKLGIPYYYFCIIANIVTTNTVWVQRWDSDNASELDVLVFTYTVDNDVVTVSDPTEEKLTVSVSEINNKIAELNANIEKQNTSLVEASSKVKELSTQIAELTPFKEAADKAEKERIEAETASKREELKNHALKSGFITESEFVSDENIKASIDNVSQKDLDAIIAERFIASLNKKESNVETSSKEKEAKKIEESTAKLNLSNSETKPVNYKEIMESFLSK